MLYLAGSEGSSESLHLFPARFSEAPEEDLKVVAQKIAKEGMGLFNEKKFAFIGNSLGGLIAFEVTHCVVALIHQVIHQLRQLGASLPVHFFPCASIPPHKRTAKSIKFMVDYKTATREEIIEVMKNNGGTPGLN